MDIWLWLAQKILTECGAVGAAGWVISVVVAVQLALERRRGERRERQMREDRLAREQRADARLDRLSDSLSEIRGRLAGSGHDC